MYVSAELYFFYDWDPSYSLYALTEAISPTADGAVVTSLDPIQIAGRNGLVQEYEVTDFGTAYIGRQYMVAKGNLLAILDVWAIEDNYLEFVAEFDAIADSFDFLE